ncbi:unnamed protein product [Trichogramma brassicae]|uniref:FHA domain-containing protein n=1 Tax=Trichogramma brassicae TaxID=86971 RepID=A0A6H5I7W2_9HYME|nr:unnamed protein product [Trichogramma brassicae]
MTNKRQHEYIHARERDVGDLDVYTHTNSRFSINEIHCSSSSSSSSNTCMSAAIHTNATIRDDRNIRKGILHTYTDTTVPRFDFCIGIATRGRGRERGECEICIQTFSRVAVNNRHAKIYYKIAGKAKTIACIVTAGGSIVTSGELRERHRQAATRSGSCASGRLIDDDLDDLDETRSGGVFSSRQSFIDLVSSKIISNTRTPTHFYHHQPQLQSSGGEQQYFSSSRDSLHHQQAYVNRGASELDLSSRGGKDKAARQLGIKDSRAAAASSKAAAAARSNFKLANCNTGMQTNNCMLNSSGVMMNTATTTTTMTTIPSREMTPSHLSVTPSSINHLVGNSACNGTETRYSYQQQQQQRGSRGYPGQSGQRGFRTGAPNWSFVFDPAGRLCYYWSMVVSLAFLYNFWVIIYRFAFQEINGETIVVWFCLDYLSDFLYVADIVFHFRTGYLEDGVLQTDATKLSQHYMNSTTFYIDCLCLLPLDFLYLSIGFNSILRSFRLVKIYRYA